MTFSTDSGAVLSRLRALCWRALVALACLFHGLAAAQAMHVQDAVRTVGALTNITVTMSGRAELRVTGAGDPLPGCIVHLNSPDAWLFLTAVAPSQVASGFLGRVRVNGASAVLDGNVRVAQYGPGAVVIPHAPGLAPLEVFDGRHFTGPSRKLHFYARYDGASLGVVGTNIGSFKLKRGYMATFAQQENGNGISRNYVAQDGDLEVGRLPAALENNVRFVRVFPWRWVGKKGVAGNIESGLNVDWLYNWNMDRNSPLDWEYVPIRQTRWWPGLDQDWQARGANHLLGYNEPDRPDQANMTVGDAIWSWPDLLWTGLRVGAPAVSDGGLNWLYDFMAQADAAGLRVDYVPVHYYRCFGNVGDPAGTANQFYNFLKGIYDVVKRPLWITEWNNGANWTGCADPSFAQQAAAVDAIIDMLDNTPFVERYAIYNWVEDVRRVKWDDGSLTSAGVIYRDQNSPLAYRQEMADAGVGSSARYAFDGDTHDGWGNGQDAMQVGAPTFTGGKYGQAIALNGATDYLQVSPRLSRSTDWSFAGWVMWGGGGGWQRIFDLGDDNTHYLFLSPRTAGGLLRFAIQNGNGEQQLSGPPLVPGVWTHVAVTIAGNTGKLFVDGVPVATNTSMTINPIDVGTKYNYLGKSRFSADPLFNGRFDDFRFISSALTDAQVAAIYHTPPPQFVSSTIHKPEGPIGQPYNATLAGTAVGTGALTFSKMDGPAWLTVTPNGHLTGTPSAADGGVNEFLVRVTDTNGSLHTARLQITVPMVTVTIASSADDAEQSATGAVTLDSTDLELVRDDGTSSGNQIVGLRFADVSVPRGAVITGATIQFSADESQSEPTALSIAIEASDHAAPFTPAANNLSSRALTSLTVPWQPAAWTAGQSNATQLTPNLAGLVQDVVSRPGWANGHALVFLISGSGHRTADSFDKNGGSPARLSITFSSPTPVLTMSVTVNGSANDAEQSSAGVVTLNSTDLELVNDEATGAGDQIIGVRFENVALPANAILASAHLQFSADETQDVSTALTLRAQATDNALPFTTAPNDLSSRPLTAAQVPWSPAAWNHVGERNTLQRSPDVSELVREVITRPGWASGHAMAFLISGTGHRTADAADKAGGLPATLTVHYTTEVPRGTYEFWVAARTNLSNPTADLDGDGYWNLFEYALGLDPAVPNIGATLLVVAGNLLHLTYVRPVGNADLAYEVQWAERIDAVTWNTFGVTQQILSDDGINRVIRAVIPKGVGSQRFVRLKVSR